MALYSAATSKRAWLLLARSTVTSATWRAKAPSVSMVRTSQIQPQEASTSVRRSEP